MFKNVSQINFATINYKEFDNQIHFYNNKNILYNKNIINQFLYNLNQIFIIINNKLSFFLIKSFNYKIINLKNSFNFKFAQIFYDENSKSNKRFYIEKL